MKTFCKSLNRNIPLLLISLVVGCSKPPETDARLNPPLVIVTKATFAAGEQPVYTGVVTARVESNVGFRVAGKVIERTVDVGQAVHKGQLLMRLDRKDLVLNHSAQVAAVVTAKAKYIQAVADEARLNGLSEQGAISAQAYDAVKAALDAAKATLTAAQAQAKIAENADSYADLLADNDGVVTSVLAEPGQVVAAGQIVVRIAKNASREAEVYLPEGIRPKIGSAATASVYGAAANKYIVSLRELSQSADPVSRTFTARYVIADSAAIPLGATISVVLNGTGNNLLQVPLGAILNDGRTAGIWIVNPNNSTVSLRSVTLKRASSDFAIVEGEVSREDQVVALGAHLLHEGDVVKVADISKVALQ